MRKKTVLLIDKCYAYLDIMKKVLQREGYAVQCVSAVQEAREFLAGTDADAIIMEIDMPDGSGIDFCRQHRAIRTTPIMLQSSTSDDERGALDAGACYFLRKPFDLSTYRHLIHTMTDDIISLPLLPAGSVNPVKASAAQPAVPRRDDKTGGIRFIRHQAFITLAACAAVAIIILGFLYIRGQFKTDEIVFAGDQPVPLAAPPSQQDLTGSESKDMEIIIIN